MAKNLLTLVPKLSAWEVDLILRVTGSEFWWDNNPNIKPPPHLYAFIDVEELIMCLRVASAGSISVCPSSLIKKLEVFCGKEPAEPSLKVR